MQDDVEAVNELFALQLNGLYAVDVNARDTQGRTALMLAAREGHESVVRALLRASSSADGTLKLKLGLMTTYIFTLKSRG